MAGRCIIAFFMLFAIALVTRKNLLAHLKEWWKLLTFAFFSISLSWVGLGVGQEGTSVVIAAVLDAVIPISTFIIMVVVLREFRFTFEGFIGLLLGVISVIIFIGLHRLASADATVAAYVTFAANGVLVEKWSKGIDPLVTSTYFLFFASIMLSGLAFIFEKPESLLWTTDNYLEELLLGLFCTGAGYYGYYLLVYNAGSYFSSFIFFLIPAMGMVAGIFILKEDFIFLKLLGVPIVLAGVYIVNKEKLKKGLSSLDSQKSDAELGIGR